MSNPSVGSLSTTVASSMTDILAAHGYSPLTDADGLVRIMMSDGLTETTAGSLADAVAQVV